MAQYSTTTAASSSTVATALPLDDEETEPPIAAIDQNLPKSFTNHIVAHGIERGIWRMKLRVNTRTREEAYQWKQELERNTHTDYNYRWVKQQPERYVWTGRFLCSRTDQGKQMKSTETRALERPDIYKATGCRHSFNMRIDHADARLYSNDPQRAHYVQQGYLTEITLNEEHNHEITDWVSSNYLRAEDETRMRIASLLKSGMTPQEAIAHMADGKTHDEVANNRLLPKPHVYYEIARVMRTQNELDKLAAAKTSTPGIPLRPATTPSRVLKRGYINNEPTTVLPPSTQTHSSTSDATSLPVETDVVEEIVDDGAPAIPMKAKQEMDDVDEEPIDDHRHLMTIPSAPGRARVAAVSMEEAMAFVQATGDKMRLLLAKASARRWPTSSSTSPRWDVRDRMRYIHNSIGELVPATFVSADGTQYIEGYEEVDDEEGYVVRDEEVTTSQGVGEVEHQGVLQVD